MSHDICMEQSSLLVYLASVAVLFAKYVAITLVQAQRRFALRSFRWPEDAATWKGEHVRVEDERIERAQAALRNDGETQPFYLAIAGAWIALGAPFAAACIACGSYALARSLHSFFMIHPRQPLRNRFFGLGQIVLLLVLIDAIRRAA